MPVSKTGSEGELRIKLERKREEGRKKEGREWLGRRDTMRHTEGKRECTVLES